VLDYDPGKKLVLSGLSEYHTQLDQWIFMGDNQNPNMTVGWGGGGVWGEARAQTWQRDGRAFGAQQSVRNRASSST